LRRSGVPYAGARNRPHLRDRLRGRRRRGLRVHVRL